MQWTFFICILVTGTIIASSVTNEVKRSERSLSFLTSFLLSGLGNSRRPQAKVTRAPRRKSSKGNKESTLPKEKKEEVVLTERNQDGNRRNRTRSKTKRIRNNENTSLTNFANDPYQAISESLGTSNATRTVTAKTTTEQSTETTTRIQNFSNRIIANDEISTEQSTIIQLVSGNRITANNESRTEQSPKIQLLSGNRILAHDEPTAWITDNFNIDQTMYDTPGTYTIPSELQFVNPMFSTPRKYSYKQGKVGTAQKYALNDNFNVIVTESDKLLSRPAYLDDKTKDIIFSVPPYGQVMYPSGVPQQYDDRFEHIISNDAPYVNQYYPSPVNQQYQEAAFYPNMVFDRQHGNFNVNVPRNYLSEYTGDPIIVMDDTSTIIKTAMPFQDKEISERIEENKTEKPRGDLSD